MKAETVTKFSTGYNRWTARMGLWACAIAIAAPFFSNKTPFYLANMVLLAPAFGNIFTFMCLRGRCPLTRFATCYASEERKGLWKYAVQCACVLLLGTSLSVLFYGGAIWSDARMARIKEARAAAAAATQPADANR